MIPEKPIAITVENANNAGPVGKLVFPTPNATLSGTVKLTGWAYDPDGKIQSVDFSWVCGQVGTLTYGVPAPEACAALTTYRLARTSGSRGISTPPCFPNGQHLLIYPGPR